MKSKFYRFSAKLLVFLVIFGVSGVSQVLAQTADLPASFETDSQIPTEKEVGDQLAKPVSAPESKLVKENQRVGNGGLPARGAQAGNQSPQSITGLSFSTVQNYGAGKTLKPEIDQSSGALVYRYGIDLPPGRNGITPELSLTYNSQDKKEGSFFGLGWNINTPYIERMNLRGTNMLYTDSAVSGSQFFYSSLHGELTCVSGSCSMSQNSSFWRPRIELAVYPEYNYIDPRDMGVNHWELLTADGKQYTFGEDVLSSSRIFNPNNSNQVFRWYLEKIVDKNGNRINFKYQKIGEQVYPDTITYTDRGSADGLFQIKFIRESRPDKRISYAAGFKIETTERVKAIEIYEKSSGSPKLRKQYDFSYIESGPTKRSLLKSITETGYDENGQNPITLPKTEFSYTPSQLLFDSQPTSVGLPGDLNFSEGVMPADLNEDGFADLIQLFKIPNSTEKRRVFLNNRNLGFSEDSGWTFPSDVTLCEMRNPGVCDALGGAVFDANGDQKPDLVISKGSSANESKVYLKNGPKSWLYSPNWALLSLIPTSAERPQVVDVNADGLLDVCAVNNSVSTNCRYNSGDSSVGGFNDSSFQRQEGTRFADINADGLVDAVRQIVYWSNISGHWVEKEVRVKTESAFAPDLNWQLPLATPVDWKNAIEFDDLRTGQKGLTGTFLMDLNGDGFPDWINKDGEVYLNNGQNGWTLSSVKIPIGDPTYDDNQYADVNADGLVDIFLNSKKPNCSSNCYETKVYLNKSGQGDLLSQITLGSGGKISYEYVSANQMKDGSGAFANPNLPFPVFVVQQITETEPISGLVGETRYSYSNGQYYFGSQYYSPYGPFDKRFAGFEKVTVTLPDNSKRITYFHQGNGSNSSNFEHEDHSSKIGRSYRTDVLKSGNSLMTRSVTKWDKTDLPSRYNTPTYRHRFFVYPVQTVTEEYDGDDDHKDRAVTYTYNTLTGDLKEEISWGEVQAKIVNSVLVFDDVFGDKVRTEFFYATDNSVMRLPSEIKRFDELNKKISETRIYYDNNTALGSLSQGSPTKEEHLISEAGGVYSSTLRKYDTLTARLGLLIEEKDALGNATVYEYDQFNLFPKTVTNALGHKQEFVYDYGTGKIKETTDPNLNKWSSKYDSLGRTLEERVPNPDSGAPFLKTVYKYDDTPLKQSVKKTEFIDSNLSIDSYGYFDGFGRVIQIRSQSEDQSGKAFYSVKDFIYDKDGRLEKESLPYFSEGAAKTLNRISQTPWLYSTLFYDSLGRVEKTFNALGSTQTVFDDWKTTVIDPMAKKKEFLKDAYGRLIQVNEFNGASVHETKYEYDPAGNLKKLIDAEKNVRNFEYDLLGRRTKAEDLHAVSDASWVYHSYEYDLAGNLKVRNSPDAYVEYKYDALNRPKSEDFAQNPGIEITYAYDTCLQGKGKLCKEITANSETSYEYNPQGEVWKETKTIEGKTYVTSYGYYDDGSPRRVVNPDLSQVSYSYNKAGAVEKILGKEANELDERILIKNADYSAHGQLKLVEAANNTKTEWSYDESRLLRLQKIKATRPSLNSTKTEKFFAHPSDGVITTGPSLESWAIQHQSTTGSEVNKEGGSSYPGIEPLPVGEELYWRIYRSFFSFDTSGIPDGAVIQSARLKLTTEYALDEQNDGKGYVQLLEGRQKDANDLTVDDIALCGDMVNPDPLSLAKPIKDMRSNEAVNFDLLSGKLGLISKTGVTKLCLREGHDLDGSEPAQKLSSWFQYFTSEAQAEIQPALEVTYSFNRPETLLSIDYTYDASGNVLQTYANYEDGWLKRTFGYDDLYRLKSEEFAFIGTTLNYTFDYSSIGNIIKTSEFGDYEYQGTDANRYENPHAVTKFAGMDFSYDKRGNLTSFADWKNEFNWRNQMTKTENPLVSVSYLYDGSGARIAKTSNNPASSEIKYHYPTDSFNIEYKDRAEKISKHITLADFPIVTIETTKDAAGAKTTKTFFNHPDHLNSFTVATDESAEDIEHLVYMAFGRSWRRPAGNYREQRNFTGHVFDGETGYLYAKARYLDSFMGRFVSQDPAFWVAPELALYDPQLFNSYSYARNNPLRYIDPDGAAPRDVVLYIAGFINSASSNMLLGAGRSSLSDPSYQKGQFGGDIFSVGIGAIEAGGGAVFAVGGAVTCFTGVGCAALAGGAAATAHGVGVIGTSASNITETIINNSYSFSKSVTPNAGSNSVKSAYEVALSGGKHWKTLRDYSIKSTKEIGKAAESLLQRAEEHLAKIANPSKYAKDFNKLTQKELNGLINKWEKEVQGFLEESSIMLEILGRKLK